MEKKYMPYQIIRIFHIFLIITLIGSNVLSYIIPAYITVTKGIIYVDDDANPDWYDTNHVKTIAEGIINASIGDTIYVYNGTYYENINVSKSLFLIGEDPHTTIIDCRRQGNIITIETNNITVSGFTLQNETENTIWERWAIKIQKNVIGLNSHLRNITISQCFIINNKGGILLHNVSDCKIQNCNIYNNSYSSIVIRYCSSNIQIDNSTIIHNGKQINETSIYNGGIIIHGYNELCTNLEVKNCTFYENFGMGLYLIRVQNMIVDHSVINDNSWNGVSIGQSVKNITIHHNDISGNSREGIYINDGTTLRVPFRSIQNILIHNNTLTNNGKQLHGYGGMYISNCVDGIRIIDNDIISNDRYGVYFDCSRKNHVINNNFINNTCNAYFSNYRPIWNYWNGNYWDTWIGFGPKMIKGKGIIFPWFNFDWNPVH